MTGIDGGWRGNLVLLLCFLLISAGAMAYARPLAGGGPGQHAAPWTSDAGAPAFRHAFASRASRSRMDWSRAVADTTLKRFSNPRELGRWNYMQGFYLYGLYLVYRRTHDRRYLNFIRGWVDSHVDASGKIDAKIDSLDSMQSGNLLLILYRITKQKKYKLAAEEIRRRLDTYPRTRDGGFWHATGLHNQLWLDGLYMSLPFLVHYGKQFHDSRYADNEAVHQLLVYHHHLNDPETGLLFHAYDESGASAWANPVTHHSPVFWGRSIGWYGMALVTVLDALPRHHRQQAELVAMLRELVHALARYQDPKTGLWFQVVNRPDLKGNWLETSSSCMFTYVIARAVEEHYVAKKYLEIACKGYRGILGRLIRDADGSVHIPGICEGTGVGGNVAFYLTRKRNTDDFHGLGAFLVMNELMRRVRCAQTGAASQTGHFVAAREGRRSAGSRGNCFVIGDPGRFHCMHMRAAM